MKIFVGHTKAKANFLSWSKWLLLPLLLPFLSPAQELTLSRQLVPWEISKHATHAVLEDRFGFIWLGGNGLFRYDGYDTEEYLSAKDSTGGIGSVRALLEDQRGNIWIGSLGGLFYYNRQKDLLQHFYNEKLANPYGNIPGIWSLFEDSKQQIWIGTDEHIFVLNDSVEGEIKRVQNFEIGGSNWLSGGVVNMVEDPNGHILAATSNGLWEIGNDLIAVPHIPTGLEAGIMEFRVDDLAWGRGDTLWLATPEGLWSFDNQYKQFKKMSLSGIDGDMVGALFTDEHHILWLTTKDQIYRLQPNGQFQKVAGDAHYLYDGIEVLYSDRQGNLWFGSNHGAGMLDFNAVTKIPFYQIGHGSPYHDNHFYRVTQDSAGGFWFRMYRSGLGYCPYLGGPFEIRLKPPVQYFREEVKGICTDVDGNVWVVTYTNGLFLFAGAQREYQKVDMGDSLRHIAIPAAIFADQFDDHFLWLSTRAGLCKLNRLTLQRQWFYPRSDLPWLDLDAINMMGQDDQGNIWCTLSAHGHNIIGYFDRETEKFTADRYSTERPVTTRIYQFQQVAPNEMWVATNRGMVVVNTQMKTQRFWTTANGFPTNDPLALTPDKLGNVWFTSGQNIYRYDGQRFKTFDADETIERFDNTSVALTKEGLVAFGGVNGLHVFDPELISKDTKTPKVYLREFRVFNRKKALGQACELVQKITMPYRENVFSFEFAGLHFSQSKKLRYRHILEGFENEWVETGSDERRVTYTNLSPGEYTFKVLAANADGNWTPEKDSLNIKLTVLPPWYATWWACLLWVGLVFGSIWWYYQFQLKRKLAEAEARRLIELDQAKSLLYTNITHEFRTPLTIILGMVEQVKNNPKYWFNEGLKLIRRNGQQLLQLVNQLLDLSKLESGNILLKPVNDNLVAFLEYLSQSFHSYADSKDIRLHFASDFKQLYMDFDPEKLQSILSNLLSNAIKFTPAGGDVYLDIRRPESGEEKVLLQVRDNGVGIGPEHLPQIFDRFYQVDASTTRRGGGTGIGLALTRELVKLMNGEIMVESELGKGTKFSLLLKLTQQAPKATIDEEILPSLPFLNTIVPDKNQVPNPSADQRRELPLALLIEDNADVITFLTSFLSGDYRIAAAADGEAGILSATELIPDIIISDVMMPIKDGFEVCEILKADERTSHIPIILLTAKSDQAARIEGLTKGADVYLAKPFNKEELLVRMEKLIGLRKQLQDHYQRLLEPMNISKNSKPNIEDIFIKKLITIVEAHLSDEHFGLPDLCRKAGLSRSQLFRKLKALTGKSTTAFIRSIRLAKGRELLETTDLNVSEVAFEVGFSNPGYFTRMFHQEFGEPPSAVRV